MAAETATSDKAEHSALGSVRVYWRVSGLALVAVAVVGLIANAIEGNNVWLVDEGLASVLAFDWTHNAVHVVLAAIALTFGYASVSEAASKNMAKVIGIVYIALGIVGFVPAVTDALAETLSLYIEWGENVLHLALGAWGAWVGFSP